MTFKQWFLYPWESRCTSRITHKKHVKVLLGWLYSVDNPVNFCFEISSIDFGVHTSTKWKRHCSRNSTLLIENILESPVRNNVRREKTALEVVNIVDSFRLSKFSFKPKADKKCLSCATPSRLFQTHY